MYITGKKSELFYKCVLKKFKKNGNHVFILHLWNQVLYLLQETERGIYYTNNTSKCLKCLKKIFLCIWSPNLLNTRILCRDNIPIRNKYYNFPQNKEIVLKLIDL